MKYILFITGLLFASTAMGQAVVDVSLTPAGSFKMKSSEVRGFAEKQGDSVEAKNIVVGLKNVATGISLRDTHTKRYLQVDKFPEAILVSAKGTGGKGTGVLKIKGIEKNVTGTYKIDGGKLVATFPVKLSDYKITGIKYMGVGVDDTVNVNITVPLKNKLVSNAK